MLENLFQVGVSAVIGENCVFRSLTTSNINGPIAILAVGKAADSMMRGALRALPNFESALMVTKLQHYLGGLESEKIEIMEAAHPLPDASSLAAGQRMLEWVKSRPQDTTLLFLLSGGASSLVEVLVPGTSTEQLTNMNKLALSNGHTIQETNKTRLQLSAIKGGQLLEHFSGKRVHLLYISDVEGDCIDTIGSGIGARPNTREFDYETRLVGSNKAARQAIIEEAHRSGLNIVENQELLYDDVAQLAPRLAQRVINGPSGLYVWGGESTVHLPANPGHGGRNQCLALRFAKEIAGHRNVKGLFAGTDGTDGPTKNAGGIVDGQTFNSFPGGQAAIQNADSGSFLAKCNALFYTGPTGTNVMDLGLVYKT